MARRKTSMVSVWRQSGRRFVRAKKTCRGGEWEDVGKGRKRRPLVASDLRQRATLASPPNSSAAPAPYSLYPFTLANAGTSACSGRPAQHRRRAGGSV